MKKIILVISFAFFGFLAAQAQTPIKSAKAAPPQFEKSVPDKPVSTEPKATTDKKKDDCSGKDMKKCGSKGKKSCCKGEVKKES
ncbi:MAG: hypothetical protein ACHQK8_01040 [Bacteroidia bacterium]